MHAIGLEGYIFEGTVVKLIKYLQGVIVPHHMCHAESASHDPPVHLRPDYLILDMACVHGINETAGSLLAKFTRQVC